MIKTYLYTLEIAVFSTLLAAVVGLVMAYFTSKRTFPGRRLILASTSIPLCVPPLIIALAYVSFWGVNGTVNKLLAGVVKSPITFLYSTLGIVLAQGFYNFPLVTGIVTKAWEQLPQENENAARLLGASEKRILFTVTLPRLKGAIAAACIPVFLYCFFSFMIVLLFSPVGKSTVEVEIYHSIRSTLDIKNGAGLAALEAFTAIGIVFLYSLTLRRSQSTTDGVGYVPFERGRVSGRLERGIFAAVVILIVLFFICPLISILQPGREFLRLFEGREFWRAVGRSFAVGCCTSTVCCVFAFMYAIFVKLCGHQENPVLQTIPLIPMAISSVVLAWVFGLIFHRGTPVLLVVLESLLYWPLAYRQIQNGLNRISFETDRAVLLLSKNKLDSVWRFYLPACKPLIISSFFYCFAVSLGDATLPLVLSIPKFTTLSLYVYKLASTYKFKQACAAGVFMIFICLYFYHIIPSLYKSKKFFPSSTLCSYFTIWGFNFNNILLILLNCIIKFRSSYSIGTTATISNSV